VHAILRRQGWRVGRKRVERLMRQHGLQGAFLRKRWRIPSTRQDPTATPAPDLVNRNFTATEPDRLWVADATRIPTGEGAFWLAAVRDAFSNRIVGWKTSDRCDTDLVLGALEYAIWSRDVRAGRLVHHATAARPLPRSGSPVAWPTAEFCRRWARSATATTALMENFFSALKIELVYRHSWRTRDEAENAIFSYIDDWYTGDSPAARTEIDSPTHPARLVLSTSAIGHDHRSWCFVSST
jgi:putative transposase